MSRAIILLIFLCMLGCTEKNKSISASFGFSKIPDSSFVNSPQVEFNPSDYIIQPKHLKKYYDHPGELGYIAEGANYGFKSLSVIMALAMPEGGPPLHTHDVEELHIVHVGTVEYIINGKRFVANGPYIVKIPADVPHTFINRGEIPANVVGILPLNNTSYEEVGPNPMLDKSD